MFKSANTLFQEVQSTWFNIMEFKNFIFDSIDEKEIVLHNLKCPNRNKFISGKSDVKEGNRFTFTVGGRNFNASRP